MQAGFLKRNFHFAPRLAALHAAEWQHQYTDWDARVALTEFAAQHDDGRLPTTLIALEHDLLLGSISLIEDDLPGWEHLTPWVASVYVLEQHRGAGIGAFLLDEALQVLHANAVTQAYLFTQSARGFFLRAGWEDFAPAVANGHAVTIMVRTLSSPDPHIRPDRTSGG